MTKFFGPIRCNCGAQRGVPVGSRCDSSFPPSCHQTFSHSEQTIHNQMFLLEARWNFKKECHHFFIVPPFRNFVEQKFFFHLGQGLMNEVFSRFRYHRRVCCTSTAWTWHVLVYNVGWLMKRSRDECTYMLRVSCLLPTCSFAPSRSGLCGRASSHRFAKNFFVHSNVYRLFSRLLPRLIEKFCGKLVLLTTDVLNDFLTFLFLK